MCSQSAGFGIGMYSEASLTLYSRLNDEQLACQGRAFSATNTHRGQFCAIADPPSCVLSQTRRFQITYLDIHRSR